MENKKKTKFRHLKSFLKKQNEFLSILDLDNSIMKLDTKFFEDKCELLFNYSKYNNGHENVVDAIYLTKNGYYFYLSRIPEFDETYDIKIIYDSLLKKSEVLLFIKTLTKSKKL